MSELSNTGTTETIAPAVTSTESLSTNPATEELLAGKYKNKEGLINGYYESQRKISELGARLKEYEPPESYVVEENISEESKAQLVAAAKEAGLSQSQLKRLAAQLETNEKSARESFEAAQKAVITEVGEDKIQQLDAYIDQSFPKNVAKALKENYKADKDLATELYSHRSHALSGSVPVGGNSVAPNVDRKAEMYKLAADLISNPNDMQARQKYENLAKAAAGMV